MLIKYAHIEVTLSLMTKACTLVYAWELPLVQLAHGPGSVRIFGYQWIKVNKILDPQSEYDRMEKKYKAREQNETPPMLAIYGQRLIMHQTLVPMMRECVRMAGEAGPAKPLAGYEPNATFDAPRTDNQQNRMAWLEAPAAQAAQAAQQSFFTGPGGPQANDFGEDPLAPQLATENDGAGDGQSFITVPLPPGIPVDGQGRLSKSNAELVLTAMGIDPDPEMSHQEAKDYLAQCIVAELTMLEKGALTAAPDEEGHYADKQIVTMFADLRAAGYDGTPLVEAA